MRSMLWNQITMTLTYFNCKIGPDTGASHIANTGNLNVMIAVINGTFAVGVRNDWSERGSEQRCPSAHLRGLK